MHYGLAAECNMRDSSKMLKKKNNNIKHIMSLAIEYVEKIIPFAALSCSLMPGDFFSQVSDSPFCKHLLSNLGLVAQKR